MNKYAQFFAAFNNSVRSGNPYSKEELISMNTDGRTTSLKDLTDAELREIIDLLNVSNQARQSKADKMRKAIIAIFKDMERTTAQAIAWAEKQGVKGVKKKFNSYTTGELYVLIQIAEKIQIDWRKGVRKKTLNSI